MDDDSEIKTEADKILEGTLKTHRGYKNQLARKSAEDLSESLLSLEIDLATNASTWFSDYHLGLLQENIGLLTGISKGTISEGTEILRNNYLELLLHLETSKPIASQSDKPNPPWRELPDQTRKHWVATKMLKEALRRCAMNGFTIEGQKITDERVRSR